jgi:phosphopentomutase
MDLTLKDIKPKNLSEYDTVVVTCDVGLDPKITGY